MQFCALVLSTVVFVFPLRSYQNAPPQAPQPLSHSIHDIEEAIDDSDDPSLLSHNNNDDNYEDEDYDDDYDDQDGDQDPNTGSTGVLSFLRELKNVTRHAGKTVKFLCEVQVALNVTGGAETAGDVKVTWRQNEVVVDEEEKRFKVRNTKKTGSLYISILRISQLDPFDKGFYSCQAQRGAERIKSEGFLEVVNKWGAPISNIPQIRGGTEELTTLYTHHSRHPAHPSPITEPPQTIQPVLPALHEQTVNNPLLFDTKHAQQAAAAAVADSGGGVGGGVTMLTTQTTTGRSSKVKGVYDGNEAFCQMYSGKVCSHLLGDRYVFVQPPMTQQRIEESLSQTLVVVSQSNDMSLGCSHYAIPSLCYSAFPLCLDHVEVNRYQQQQSLSHIQQQMRQLRSHLSIFLQRICKRDCTLLVTEVCNKEYAIAKRHPVIGKTIQLEECDDLPETTSSCIKLDVEQRERDVDLTDTCYWDDGRSYRGPIDVALNGDKCLRWGEVAQMQLRLDDYPELIGHNYCRNPDHASEPYCYTHSDPRKRHPCGLPRCARLVYMYLGGAACILTALVTLSIMIYCCKRRKSSRGGGRAGGLGMEGCGRGEGGRRDIRELMGAGNLADKNIYGNGTLGTAAHSSSGNTVEMNALLPNHHNPHFQRNADQMASLRGQHHRDALSSIPVYTNSDLTFVEELGEGAFGKVFKARLSNPKATPSRSTTPSKPTPTQLPQSQYVAVKSLKENANAKTQADFQREIELLAELQHPNIICLVGVVSKGKVGKGGIGGGGAGQPHCMLFEYMELGDLHQFMVQRGARSEEISNQQCLQIALQIALGMEYLADNHYVHRDLAARNCLVSHNLTVKIADFGLSRDMYSCDYYRVQSKSLLPVRWMPPESILYGKFSTESDVWSFGVVLWEVWSVGLQPYYGFNNQEVIGMIRNRQLLACPDGCPSYCYALMVECWAELAVRRPTFPEICHRLRVWRNNVNQMALQSQRLPTPSNPTSSLSKQQQHHLSYNTPNHHLSNPPPSGSSDYSAGYHSTSTPNHHQPLNNSANSTEAAAGRSTVPISGKHQRERHHSTSNISATKNSGNFGASGAAGGSQHSLTSSSHGSSLGTRTQSTNLSLDRQGRRQQAQAAMQLQLVGETTGIKMKL